MKHFLVVTFLIGCNSTNINTPIRVFDRPSDVALSCSTVNELGFVYDARSLSDCTPERIDQLGKNPDGTNKLLPDGQTINQPFLNALVVQSARGELSLVNVAAERVIDLSRPVPGFNFVPVGKLPEHVRTSADGCIAATANVDSCDLAVVDLPTMYNMSFVVYPRDGGAPKGFDAGEVVRRLTPTVGGKPLGARPAWIEFAPDTEPALRGWEPGGTPGQCVPRPMASPSPNPHTEYHAWVALPGCELVVELDLSATQGDPSGFTPAEVVRAIHVGLGGSSEVTDLSTLSCPSECDGAPMVPVVDGGTLSPPDGGAGRLPTTQAQPAAIGIDLEGNLGRLFVGDRVGERIDIFPFDTATGQLGAPRAVNLETGALGVSVVRISPRSEAGKFLYAVARDATVRVVDLDREVECETNPDPRGLQAIPPEDPAVNVRHFGCLPLGDPNTPRRAPLSTSPGIVLPGLALPRDVTFVHTDVPPPTASNVAPPAAGPATLVGDFAWIISSDGRAYVDDIFDACPPPNDQQWKDPSAAFNPACDPHNVKPSRNFSYTNNPGHPVPMQLDLMSHRLRGGTSRFFKPVNISDNVGQPRLTDESTPFQLTIAGLPKSGMDPCRTVPCLGTAPWPRLPEPFPPPTADTGAPFPPRYLNFFDPDRVRNETWTLAWEATIPATRRTLASLPKPQGPLDSPGRLLDAGATFCARGVLAGDKLLFVGCTSDNDCGYTESCAHDPAAPADIVDGMCLFRQNQKQLLDTCGPLLRAIRRYRILSAKQGVPIDSANERSGVTDQLLFGEIYEPEHPSQTRTCSADVDCAGVTVPDAKETGTLPTLCLTDADGVDRCLRACDDGLGCGRDFQCLPSLFGDQRCMLAPLNPDLFTQCMPELKTYEIHAGESFLVAGSVTGFFSDLQANPVTHECEIPPVSSEYVRLHQARIPIQPGLQCPALSDPLDPLPADLIDPTSGAATNVCQISESGSVRQIHFENPLFSILLEIPLDFTFTPSPLPSPSPAPAPPDQFNLDFSLVGGGFPLSVILAVDVQAQQPRYAVTAPDNQTVFVVDEGKGTVGVALRGQLLKLSTNAAAIDRSFLVR